MKLISEKLHLNNTSNLNKRYIKDLKTGDNIYVLNFIGLKDDEVPLIHTYKIEDGFKVYDKLKDYCGFSYKNENNEIQSVVLKTEKIDKDPEMRSFNEMGKIFCSDKKFIEEIIDNNIDEKIKPLQEKIKEYENQINKLLKQKENKYK